ncbi:hypothetical protein [Bosea sp. LC85]|uniref:hypothetical protein n=1 Tax=Bosea sp. LC85 TaxID=1502851 RepID=UPI0005BE6103|nr:hypothetical protein [Bosea sp. LC85]
MITHNNWGVIPTPQFKDKRIYRRYTFVEKGENGKDSTIANFMLLTCPRGTKQVHISFELTHFFDMASVYPSGFEPAAKNRILINDTQAVTMPAEVISSEIFFDRTPETQEDFDAVLTASKLTLVFGKEMQNRITFVSNPKSTEGYTKLLLEHFPNGGKFMTTSDGMRDCDRFRKSRR